MIRCLFLDFDGTIYSHRSNGIPASTIEALRKLHDKGILIYLCTGRSRPEMDYFDLKDLCYDGMILCNGVMIFNRDDRMIYHHPVKGQLKEKLIDLFKRKQIPIFFITRDDLFISFINETVVRIQETINSVIPHSKDYENEEFYMAVSFLSSNSDHEEIQKLKDRADITYWHQGAVDIVPKGVSKKSGIDVILNMHGLKIEETMAIGDGENDIAMLRHCRIGIAMGNSEQEVKDAADYITDDIDQDGLYKALQHFELI